MSDHQRADRNAEVSVLAACLASKPARIEARRHLVGKDFFWPDHETMWDAMARLDRHGKAVDPNTLLPLAIQAGIHHLLTELITAVAFPDHVGDYAAIVRSWSIRRNVEAEALRVLQAVANPAVNPAGFVAQCVTRFQAIRDAGQMDDDITAVTVAELLDQDDVAEEWVVPGLLEKRDRLMLTGEEGLGKSHLLRQFAILAAAGIHPFDPGCTFEPVRTLVIDCENSWAQVRRKMRPAVEWCRRLGRDPAERMMVDCSNRIDIRRDKDVSRIHRLLDALQPEIVVIGPLYRLVPVALQTDDDTAPVLAALDTIRETGAALLMEAHAGHAQGKGGMRDMRPRGSSSLLGWPEFGFGMRGIGTAGYADVVPWRGQREERNWPQRLKKADGFRWMPTENLYAVESELA